MKDEDYQEALGDHWTLEMVQQIPRRQFLPSEVQPELARYAETSPDGRHYNQHSEIAHTYSPFQTAYQRIMPPRCWDRYKHDHFARCRHHSAKYVLCYVQAIWRAMVSLIYGREVKNIPTIDAFECDKFIANIVALADHFGMLESISPGLERTLLGIKNIWSHVSFEENQEFNLLLGYHIKSVAFFIDVAKHVVSRRILLKTRYCQTRSLTRYYVPPGYYAKGFMMPNEVYSFLKEAEDEMRAYLEVALQILKREVRGIFESDPSQRSRYSDTNARAAQLLLLQYTFGSIYNFYTWDVLRQQNSTEGWEIFQDTGDKIYKCEVLWHLRDSNRADELIVRLSLCGPCASLGLDAFHVAHEILRILQFANVSHILDCMFGNRSSATCAKCTAGSSRDAVYALSIYYDPDYYDETMQLPPKPPTVCDVHGLRVRDPNTSGFTSLPGWEAKPQSHNDQSGTSWPPPATEYKPNRLRPTLPKVKASPASQTTLIALGFSEKFRLKVDAQAASRFRER